jgi:probable rRNA maturation factor
VISSLIIKNHQRRQRIDSRLLRRMTLTLLESLLNRNEFHLAIHIVNAPRMTVINETFLQHEGSTDVITFDYNDPAFPTLSGELFICLDEAVIQAARFHTSWQSELARYVVHGILHLCGHDDHDPVKRRAMKRQEGQLLKKLDARFSVRKLALPSIRPIR